MVLKPEKIYARDRQWHRNSSYENINCVTPTFGTPGIYCCINKNYTLSNMTFTSAAYDLVSLTIDAFENVGTDNMDGVYEYIKNATRDCMSGNVNYCLMALS